MVTWYSNFWPKATVVLLEEEPEAELEIEMSSEEDEDELSVPVSYTHLRAHET